MKPVGIFEFSRWQEQVYRLIAQTKRGAVEIVREEVRYALEFVMKFTPPSDYAQGRAAVDRDIKRTMRSVTAENFTESKVMREIVKSGKIEEFNRRSPYLTGPLKGARAIYFSPVEHSRFRDKRGRVLSDHRQVVLGTSQARKLKRYTADVKNFVGWARAGWARALSAIGGKVPSWVARHSDKAGDVIDELKHPHGPQFTVVNNTAWGNREGGRIARNAIVVRSNVMRKKIERMIREEVTGSGGEVR